MTTATTYAPESAAKLRPIKCRACGGLFSRVRPMQVACSLPCSIRVAQDRRAKQERRDAIEDRKETRAKLRAMEPLAKFLARARDAVHGYVRLRDFGLPCFDCGQPMQPNKYGGSVDAGHVFSVGSAPEKRFLLTNIFAEAKNCNRAGGATQAAKEAGARARLGPDRWAVVSGPYQHPKWTREYLERLARVMNKKARRQAARIEART